MINIKKNKVQVDEKKSYNQKNIVYINVSNKV